MICPSLRRRAYFSPAAPKQLIGFHIQYTDSTIGDASPPKYLCHFVARSRNFTSAARSWSELISCSGILVPGV